MVQSHTLQQLYFNIFAAMQLIRITPNFYYIFDNRRIIGIISKDATKVCNLYKVSRGKITALSYGHADKKDAYRAFKDQPNKKRSVKTDRL